MQLTESAGAAARELPRLSIIIVNYNGRHFLPACLQSIQQYCDVPCEVICVDNASHDDSVALLAREYPWVRLVASTVNLGFSGGNNLGAGNARGDLLLLLNNDTKLLMPLSPLVQIMDARPDTGALGCRLQFADGRLQNSVGFDHGPWRLVLAWLGLARCRLAPDLFRLKVNDPAFYDREHRSVDWVWGACLLTRAGSWKELGGFDSGYFMYVEDVDYCKRLRMAGQSVGYTPEVSIVHYSTAEGGAWPGRRVLLWTMDSYLRYTRKFHGRSAALLSRLSLAMVMLLRSLYYQARWLVTRAPLPAEIAAGYRDAAARLVAGHAGRENAMAAPAPPGPKQ